MAGRTTGRRTMRVLAALALGAGAVAATAACSPITTLKPYAPSDGVRAVLGDDITVENLLVLTAAEGDPALVVGGVTNRGNESTSVSITFADGVKTTLQVGANRTVLLDPANDDGQTVLLEESPGAPGSTLAVTISTPEAGATQVNVPVLDGTLAPYDTYIEDYATASSTSG